MDSTKANDAPVVKKRKKASLTAKKARVGWIFVLPFIVGLIILYLGVILESIEYSFATYATIPAVKGGGYSLTWVGLENYATILPKTVDTETGETFIEMMFTGFGSQIVEVVAIILLSLFLAVILNQKMIGRAAFRAIFFLPVVVGAGIIAQIDFSNALLESMSSTEAISTGAVQTSAMSAMVDAMDISMMFQGLGFGTELVEVVTELVGNIYDIVNRAGVQMLIFLAGLQSISPSIYESCQMEGATAWEMFWKITLPMISPMILANAVYTVIDSFTAESNSVMTYILGLGSSVSPSGTQAAAAWSYFIVVIVMLILAYLVLGKVIYYDRRNDS